MLDSLTQYDRSETTIINYVFENTYSYCELYLDNNRLTKQDIENFIATGISCDTLKPEANLLFDKNSKFPRVKLSISDFNKVNKIEKADCVVVPNPKNGYYSIYFLDSLYLMRLSNGILFSVRPYIMRDQFKDSFEYFSSQLKQILPNIEVELVYFGRVITFDKTCCWIAKYLNKELDKPFILDSELEKAISPGLQKLDFDSLCQIKELLNSPDRANIQVALQMLSGYDVLEYPVTVRVLLNIYNRWIDLNLNTVNVKHLLKTLNLDNPTRWTLPFALKQACNWPDPSEKDVKMAKLFMKDAIKTSLETYIGERYIHPCFPTIRVDIVADDDE